MKLTFFIVSLFFAGSAFAQLITVREESGFSRSYDGGDIFTLTHNGPSALYNYYGDVFFSLSYQNDTFVMTAVTENPRFGGSPHGLGIYPFGVTPVPSIGGSSAPSNDLGFVPFVAYPSQVGQEYIVALPSIPAIVPEPSTLALSASLVLFALIAWKKVSRNSPDQQLLIPRPQSPAA